jgi:hypothetical protein
MGKIVMVRKRMGDDDGAGGGGCNAQIESV